MDNLNDMSEDIQNNRYYQRLDRIEEKIDKLSDAVVAIARAEERIIAIEADKQDYWNRLNNHSQKIETVEDAILDLKSNLKLLQSLFETDRDSCVEKQKDHSERISSMELKTAEAIRTTSLVNKAFLLFMSGVLAYAGNTIFEIF